MSTEPPTTQRTLRDGLAAALASYIPAGLRLHLLRLLLNRQYKRYGTMTQLRIDNVAKTVDVELMLQGEKEPISIHIGQYQLSASGESPTLTIGQITISRQWMEAIAADYLRGKPLPLDPHMAKWLGIIL